MDQSPFRVVLSPEYDEQLKKQVMTTIKQAVEEARRQTGIDSPWLSSKHAIAKWLKVTDTTVTVLIKSGMPVHEMPEVNKTMGYKREIMEWVLSQ